MSTVREKKRSGYLLIAAGCMFFLAAFIGNVISFYGIGAMFLAIGASYLLKSKGA